MEATLLPSKILFYSRMKCLSEASKKGDEGSVQVEYNYTGPQQTDLATHIKDCNPRGPLVVHVSKLLPKPDSSGFDAYARVFSGSVKPGDRVRVLGEAYDPDDEEDSVTATVSRIWIFQAQYRVPISSAAAGLTHPPVLKFFTLQYLRPGRIWNMGHAEGCCIYPWHTNRALDVIFEFSTSIVLTFCLDTECFIFLLRTKKGTNLPGAECQQC